MKVLLFIILLPTLIVLPLHLIFNPTRQNTFDAIEMFFDIFQRSIRLNGTVTKSYLDQSVMNELRNKKTINRYIVEIETDNGEKFTCRSKECFLEGDIFLKAYATKKSHILFLYEKANNIKVN